MPDTDLELDYYILRTRKPPVAADRARVEFGWPKDAREDIDGSLEVAPGVRVKVLGWGDNMVGGAVVSGALVVVQRRCGRDTDPVAAYLAEAKRVAATGPVADARPLVAALEAVLGDHGNCGVYLGADECDHPEPSRPETPGTDPEAWDDWDSEHPLGAGDVGRICLLTEIGRYCPACTQLVYEDDPIGDSYVGAGDCIVLPAISAALLGKGSRAGAAVTGTGPPLKESPATRVAATPAQPEPRVTRFEVIDHRKDAPEPGRALVAYGVQVTLSRQDDGTTLKVFLDSRDAEGDHA